MLRSGARWMTLLSVGWIVAKFRRIKPKSATDNSPLGELLQRLVPLERLPELVRQEFLCRHSRSRHQATAPGDHITFLRATNALMPWVRTQRLAVRDKITHAHLLASSAIPFVFPATELHINGHTEYFGDGSMRQSAPIAPAIHLGAERSWWWGLDACTSPRTAHLHTTQHLPEHCADCRPPAVQHLPGRPGRGRGAGTPHQPDHRPGAAGASPVPCARWTCW